MDTREIKYLRLAQAETGRQVVAQAAQQIAAQVQALMREP